MIGFGCWGQRLSCVRWVWCAVVGCIAVICVSWGRGEDRGMRHGVGDVGRGGGELGCGVECIMGVDVGDCCCVCWLGPR